MSHLVTVQTRLRDPVAIAAACTHLGLSAPVAGTAQLFSGTASGLLVQLPGWQYPVVIDTATGETRYDNFGGRWGEAAQLDRFLQRYAAEKCRLEAIQRGHVIHEQTLPDGSLKLTIVQSN